MKKKVQIIEVEDDEESMSPSKMFTIYQARL